MLTVAEIRDALASASATLSIYLPPGRRYSLEGAKLVVNLGKFLHLFSSGEGATIDGQHRSRLFEVHGSLRLEKLALVNGFDSSAVESEAQDGGAVLRAAGASSDQAIAYVALIEVTIANTMVRSTRAVQGGVLDLRKSTNATLINVSIVNTSVSAGDWVAGGVINVRHCRHPQHGTSMTLSNVSITNTSVSASTDISGGIIAKLAANISMTAITIAETSISAERYIQGAVLYNWGAAANLANVTISGTSTRSGAGTDGGVIFIENDEVSVEIGWPLNPHSMASVTLSGVRIVNTSTSSLGAIEGGVIHLSLPCTLTLVDTAITHTLVLASAIKGGVIALDARASAVFTRAVITNTSVGAAGDRVDGGVLFVDQNALATLFDSVVDHTAAHAVSQARGGCFYSRGDLTLFNTRVAHCSMSVPFDCFGTFTWPTLRHSAETFRDGCDHTVMAVGGQQWRAQGGAFYVDSGNLVLTDGSSADSNAALTGRTLFVQAGSALYVLPAPAGRWVAGVKCEVYREACERALRSGQYIDPSCPGRRAECSTLLDAGNNETAVASAGGMCRPALELQPCNWRADRQGGARAASGLALLGRVVHALPPGPLDSDYPLKCAAGLLGSSDPLYQASSLCAGRASAGTYQPLEGGTEANVAICDTGAYCPEGSLNPLSCESGAGIPNAVTPGPGRLSSSDCVCKAGFHDTSRDESSIVRCAECPSGSDCHSAGETLSTLPIKRGYFRPSNHSLDVRRCPDAATNCSDTAECTESTSGCRGTIDSPAADASNGSSLPPGRLHTSGLENGCNPGLTGIFCLLCAPSDSRVYYSSATSSELAECRECRDLARDTILIALGIATGVGATATLLAVWYHRYTTNRLKQQLSFAWKSFTPHVKLKVLIGFYMIATKVREVYEVELPPDVRRLLFALSVGVSFGFNGLGTLLECLDIRGYVATLALYMIAPFVFALLILLISLAHMACKGQCSGADLLETAVPPLLELFFLAYPLVTNVAFDAFSCYPFLESEWLKADVAIQCHTAEHDEAKALAVVAIILYPVGLLVLNASLLYAARRAILTQRPTPLSRATAFLHREFEPQFFFWEVSTRSHACTRAMPRSVLQ